MNTESKIKQAVILCGGLGLRLRKVLPNLPKSLAVFGNTAFLDLLLDYFSEQGISQFILCTGHLSEKIEKYSRESRYAPQIVISEEHEPLGTAGAIKNAQTHITDEFFLAANGDSYCKADLRGFIQFHFSLESPLISLVLSKDPERLDAGNVRLDHTSSKITAYEEKSKGAPGYPYINAGIYLMHKNILDEIPLERATSLEHEVFPKYINRGLYGYRTESPVLDIGTPERYQKALKFFQHHDSE